MYEDGVLATWNGRANATSSMKKDTTKALILYRKGCDLGGRLACEKYQKLSMKLNQDSKLPLIKTKEIYALLSKKLYGYGDSTAYGFERSEHVVMQHSLIGFYPILSSKDPMQLIIASSKPKSEYDCHACAPKMSFFLFVIADGKWVLDRSYINAHSMGSWGEAPESKAYQVIRLNTDEYGLFLKASSAEQGYLTKSIWVYAFGAKELKQIFKAEVEADDSATGKPPRDIWSAKFAFQKGKGRYYDIVLYKQGVEEGKPIKKEIVYRFGKERYSIVSEKKRSAPASKEHARKQYISTPMHHGGRAVATAGKDYFKFEFIGDGDIYDVEITANSFRSTHMLGGIAECKREGDALVECEDFRSKHAVVRYRYDGDRYEFEIVTKEDGKQLKTYFYNDANYLYWADYQEDKVTSLQKFKISTVR
jgi:hypothetical protein